MRSIAALFQIESRPMSTPNVEAMKLDDLNCWRIRHGQAELLVAQQGAQILSYQLAGQPPLIWLNDDYEGGETDFADVGVRVKGGVGDLLLFHNVTGDGLPDQRMIHAGLPVTSGVKWMASRWIRGRDYLG